MQLNPLAYWLQSISNMPLFTTIRRILVPVYDRMSSAVLNANGAGLAITAGGSTTAKNVNLTQVIANGVIVSIAANTNMPALAGTIAQNSFGGWAFFCNSAGTLSSLFMVQGASLALMKFPQFPVGQACLGFVYLNPTAASFIGGTTLLDAANTNAVYVNLNDGIDPYCLLGGQLTNS